MHSFGLELGNAAVVVGTLMQVLVVADIGALLLMGTLMRSLHTVRGTSVGRAGQRYRMLIVVFVVSISIGLVLARLYPA